MILTEKGIKKLGRGWFCIYYSKIPSPKYPYLDNKDKEELDKEEKNYFNSYHIAQISINLIIFIHITPFSI